jgi:protein-S-isoprenylcysteine O-methyltransferase Ste14
MRPDVAILALTYTTIVVSLIWARFRFFNISSHDSRISSRLYDPAVAIQILVTYYHLLYSPRDTIIPSSVGLVLYAASLLIFWWAISTARNLDFAFSKTVGKIITKGPYGLVRHPFYLSYVLAWGASTLLFPSILLWITLLYLVAFYVMSARAEEKVILESEYSEEYAKYKQKIGMFLPRVTRWKSWLLRLSRVKKT